MQARIYRPTPTAMQSGRANAEEWVLEYDAPPSRRVDPLMGWTSSTDTSTQVRLKFGSRAEAIDYAKREGLEFRVIEPKAHRRILKTYADNFAHNRKRSWTH